MQFLGKLKKLQKIAKETNFGPDFGLLGPDLGPKIHFCGFLTLLVAKHCSKQLSYAIQKKTSKLTFGGFVASHHYVQKPKT